MSIPNLRAIEIDPSTDPRWHNFVTALPESLIYHHPAWLQVLEEAYGCRLINLACEDDNGQLWGVLPLSYKRGLFNGRVFSSLFGSPVAGPLARNDAALAVLIHAAVERARSDAGIPLEIRVLSNALDSVVPKVIGVPIQTTYVLDLPEKPELLRLGNSHNHATVKRAVNKAIREGVRVRIAETERELWAWYGLYVDTMRRLAALPQSYQFFKVAWKRLQSRGLTRLFLAEHYEARQIKLVGGLLLLMFGRTIYYAYGGWCWENQSLRPNDALHWGAIQHACANGFRRYDLGGGSMNQGLAQYKSKWGAQPKTVYSYRYSGSNDLTIGSSKSSSIARKLVSIHAPESRLRQVALAILGRLPAKAVSVVSNWAHQI